MFVQTLCCKQQQQCSKMSHRLFKTSNFCTFRSHANTNTRSTNYNAHIYPSLSLVPVPLTFSPSPRSYSNTTILSARKRKQSHGFGTSNTKDTIFKQQRQQQQQQQQPKALILGSSGTLGSAIASYLKRHHDFIIIGSDLHLPSKDRIECIDAFIQLEKVKDSRNGSKISSTSNDDEVVSFDITMNDLTQGLKNGMKDLVGNDDNLLELDAIICASGGFAMDDDDDDNNDNQSVYENMMKMNFYPILAANEIAKEYMTTSNPGLFVAIGASAALTPAPGMFAYTSSKNAAHYYIQSIGALTGKALAKEHKSVRKDDLGKYIRRQNQYLDTMTALAILPSMLDTKANRDALPGDDFSTWTKPIDIAREIGSWVDTPATRPHSGSLVKAVTKDGETNFTLAR